jgi:hypothetical protein
MRVDAGVLDEQRLHAYGTAVIAGGVVGVAGLGCDESLTSRAWIEKHVRGTGPLGELYPLKTWTAPNPHGCIKEGDTPSWFFFLRAGGNHPAEPSKPRLERPVSQGTRWLVSRFARPR